MSEKVLSKDAPNPLICCLNRPEILNVGNGVESMLVIASELRLRIDLRSYGYSSLREAVKPSVNSQ